MENAICTILESSSSKDFISSLDKYGVCIDYYNDYERSKVTKGIFVGIVNKVYEVIPKGERGHPEHDTLFVSAKSLINSRRESQPFRVGFVGDIVHQLVDANLKQGDGIGVLKPMFFYALDIPSLCVGTSNVVVWIGKNIKDSQLSAIDTAQSSSESKNNKCLNQQRNVTDKERNLTNKFRRRIESEDDLDANSLSGSSTVSSGTLRRNVEIYRSKPVDLKNFSSTKVSGNNKLIPDSTTKLVISKSRDRSLNIQKNDHDNEFSENIVSQNTANDGSAQVSVKDNKGFSHSFYKCNSPVRCVSKEVRCSHDNYARNTCSLPNPRCEHNCNCSKVSCCNYQTTSNNGMLQDCTCKIRSFCECTRGQHCVCSRSSCCRHNVKAPCSCWNCTRSCHGGNYSCKRQFDHNHGCSNHPQVNSTCHKHYSSECQGNFANSVNYSRMIHSDKKSCMMSSHCCNKQIIQNHCYNACCCGHERIECSVNKSSSHCCIKEKESNKHVSRLNDVHEEMSLDIGEDALGNSRTIEWVNRWARNPPCLEMNYEKPSECSAVSFHNPSSCCNLVRENSRTCQNDPHQKTQETAKPIVPSLPKHSNSIVACKSDKKYVAKKKKLFSPLENSTIISERSVYNHSTIVEESTPFSSENYTDNHPTDGLPSGKNLGSSDNNVSKLYLKLPLSNKITNDEEMSAGNSEALVSRSDVQNKILENENISTQNNESTLVSVDSETEVVPNVSSQKKTLYEVLINEDRSCKNEKPRLEENNSSEESFPELRIELQSDENRQETSLFQERNSIQKESQSKNEKSHNSMDNSALLNKNVENPGSVELCCNEGIVNCPKSGEINLEDENSNEKSIKTLETEGDLAIVDNVGEEHVVKNNDINGISGDGTRKTYRSNSSTISLSLSDHSKSKVTSHNDNRTMEMDLTLVCDKSSGNVEKRKSRESSDDMELTCESKLMKRKRKNDPKGAFERESKVEGSKASSLLGENVNSDIRDFSVSSSGTYFDAQSTGAVSVTPEKWCLRPVDEFFENEEFSFLPKVLKKFGIKNSDSYNLNLLSSFNVTGIIINMIPRLSQESYGDIVKGFCNEGCRKEYRFNDFCEMKDVDAICTFCRFRYHLACPKCFKEGLNNPLCLYYIFEIHLFDGRNVLRIEIDHQSGVNFVGCTPQHYLKSKKLFKKIDRIIASSPPANWTNLVFLNAKIKVMPRSGVPVLTLHSTSLKKDLVLKGKHYKL